jgi:hypothetical protein
MRLGGQELTCNLRSLLCSLADIIHTRLYSDISLSIFSLLSSLCLVDTLYT